MSLAARVVNLIAVIAPFLGLVAAIAFLWGRGFSWVELGLLLGTYVLTALGITVGFHRLFTHRAFETGRVVQFILAALGSMAIQGPLLKWVAFHRRHHHHSDTPEDPHSPRHKGQGILGLLRGLWHAHLGWLFQPDPPDLFRYVKDLRQVGLLRTVSALFPLWVAVSLLVPSILGGLLTWSLDGGFVRPDLGRVGSGLPGPARDLERQLGLPPLGPAALPEWRPQPEQFPVRRPGAGGRLAQQSPRLPDFGPTRLALVAV
jgi:stearoyl-CoA desaturase (delta-9 desaturase)